MKVNIGKYPRYWGVYQVCELLQYVGVSKDRCHDLGTKIYDKLDGTRLGWWMSTTQHKRKVVVRIDDHDVWNMDSTLALIILPMLLKIKETKHGSPLVQDADVPDHLKAIMDTKRIDAYDIDCYHHDRWTWVLDEMIYSFNSKVDDNWDDQFWLGDVYEGVHDRAAHDAAQQRVQRGFELFGKYFSGLWT